MRNLMMRNRVKSGVSSTIAFLVTTICLVAVIAFCITGTVVSKTNIDVQGVENYYREQEQQLLTETKEYLTKLGFKNSGVTLTRVVDVEGTREYTFTIHHGKIDRMGDKERQQLAEQLSKIAVLDDNCKFYHEFLLYD